MSTTLAGHAVTVARLHVPAWGIPWAEVELAEEIDLARGTVAALALPGLDARLTVASGGPFAGRSRYRLVGGRGGWGRIARARGYRNDAGVRASMIASDLAREVGESVDTPPAVALGQHFQRVEDRASWTMHGLFPRAWRVDLDGVTRFGARAAHAYESDAVLVSEDRAFRSRVFAADEVGSLTPGVAIDGTQATDLEYEIAGGRLTIRAYAGPGALSRKAAAFEAIVRAVLPRADLAGKYEFRVVGQDGDLLALQPVRVSTGMADLDGVPDRGAAGVKVKHALGSLVLVEFVERDPSRPVVTSHDDPGSPGWRPQEIVLSAPLIRAVADTLRVGSGSSPVVLDTPLSSALNTLKGALSTAFGAIGAGTAANGASGAASLNSSLASWPPNLAAQNLEAD